MSIAGRLERVSTDAEVFVGLMEEVRESAAEIREGSPGEWRERSSMKFPAARLLGVRGRWRKSVMS